MRIVVTAGYSRSLHAAALIQQLPRRGHEVVMCLEVRALSAARIRFYLRQIGWRKLLAKSRSKMAGGGGTSAYSGEVAPIREYLCEHGLRSDSVAQVCAAQGVHHRRVRDLNDAATLTLLRKARPDVVVYAGGGILRGPFIAAAGRGVLNAHGGPLPAFRGMNAAEWSLLHGVAPETAVIFVDEGIDTGPIVLARAIPVAATDTISDVRGRGVRSAVEALLDAVDAVAASGVEPAAQRAEDGRQYFVMADPLLEVVSRWMTEGRTPVVGIEGLSGGGGSIRQGVGDAGGFLRMSAWRAPALTLGVLIDATDEVPTQ